MLLPPASIATTHNELIGPLVVARLIPQCGLAPGRLRLTANRRTLLTTTMCMVARIHNRATDGRTAAHMAGTPGFTDAAVPVIDIVYLPGGCTAKNNNMTVPTCRQAYQ